MITKSTPFRVSSNWLTETRYTALGKDGPNNLAPRFDITVTNGTTRGENIPNWRGRIKARQSATTYLSGNKVEYNLPDGYAEMNFVHSSPLSTEKYLKVVLEGPLSSVNPGIPDAGYQDLFDVANTRAVTYFVKKALGAQQAISSLVSLGEMGETVRMIRRPLQSLFNGCYGYLDSVKKRSRKYRDKPSKKQMIADTWLENAFGWQPLVNDIQSAADALARLNTYAPPSKRVNGVGRDERAEEPSRSFTSLMNGRIVLMTTRQTKHQAWVRYSGDIGVASLPTFETDVLGLSLRDIIPSIWNLIPYSFMVDYFTNVGSIIDAASLRVSDLSWAEKGLRGTSVHTWLEPTLTENSSPPWIKTDQRISAGKAFVSRTIVERTSYSGSYIPDLSFKIPGASTKWLNIAALVASSKRASSYVNG